MSANKHSAVTDYRNLRAAAGDKFMLHQLAMRAPSTISGGNHS